MKWGVDHVPDDSGNANSKHNQHPIGTLGFLYNSDSLSISGTSSVANPVTTTKLGCCQIGVRNASSLVVSLSQLRCCQSVVSHVRMSTIICTCRGVKRGRDLKWCANEWKWGGMWNLGRNGGFGWSVNRWWKRLFIYGYHLRLSVSCVHLEMRICQGFNRMCRHSPFHQHSLSASYHSYRSPHFTNHRIIQLKHQSIPQTTHPLL